MTTRHSSCGPDAIVIALHMIDHLVVGDLEMGGTLLKNVHGLVHI